MGVPSKLQPMFVTSTLRRHWVTLHSWVCHLEITAYVCYLYVKKTLGHIALIWVCHLNNSLCLLPLKETLGYIALMVVSP